MSPTQRTLAMLKKQGMTSGIVERFIKFGKFGVRKDLFGFIDIIAIHPLCGVIGVQSCGQDYSGHIKKMLSEECVHTLALWLVTNPVLLVGWRKVKLKRGGKAMRWKPRKCWFTLDGDGKVGYIEFE